MSLEMSGYLGRQLSIFNDSAMHFSVCKTKQYLVFLSAKKSRIWLVYLVSLLCCLIGVATPNSVSYAENQNFTSSRTFNDKSLKRSSKDLQTRSKSLLRSLKHLQKKHEETHKKRKQSKDQKKILKKINHTLNGIYKMVTEYFQAKRPTNINQKLYLKLRKQVWKLLDHKVNLFQMSKGRFCLRSHWERLLAKSYLSLNHDQTAQHHFLRAYRCDGSIEDLNSANSIKQTTH